MQKRILIAEDHLQTREAMTSSALSAGYSVVSVADGLEYLAAVSKEKFDLIITDLIMPDLNGVSATEIMKLGGDDTPIIAVTALSYNDISPFKDKFLKIFHKPIDIKELFEYIKTTLDR